MYFEKKEYNKIYQEILEIGDFYDIRREILCSINEYMHYLNKFDSKDKLVHDVILFSKKIAYSNTIKELEEILFSFFEDK
ncbi:hypothetical protein [Francisella hispaniensis]|uniref:Uncharacterized protein n=1 Tax=Francisella hispaniensis FSC454 TaxID=1088883 RepID=A0AAC9JB60_9GAMM|nr:hypothetical protein [Francisella hispaniensis]APD51338.1 hypothetical protein FSC454_09340 [Francisella hispaniensis FSC454]KYW82777.1 hypothetical protein AUF42_07245 [Francisella hispaniensis FSC454]